MKQSKSHFVSKAAPPKIEQQIYKRDYFSTHLPVFLHWILGHGFGLHDVAVILLHLIKLSSFHEKLQKREKQITSFHKAQDKQMHTNIKTHFVFVPLSFGMKKVFTHFLRKDRNWIVHLRMEEPN